MTLRVLVADDQELVRAGFGVILSAQDDIDVVAEASDGDQAVELARAHRPDVVLMDVRMPRTDGIVATRRIVDQLPTTRVLVLTTFDLDEHVHVHDALDAGASGFLLKDVTRDELVRAVRVVAAGDALLAPSVTRRLLSSFAASRRPPATPDPALRRLTPREHEVLLLLARGLSNAEIAGQMHVSDQTVKSHVSGVLSKLGLRDRVHAVVYAYEAGLVPVTGSTGLPRTGEALDRHG
jgi:DNA-binding NarL/FixJ family response regulator